MNDLEKEFVPYEQALALKELGFNEPCFGYYLCKNSALGVYLEITTEWIDLLPYDSSSCKVPTFSQAFRWFREKYGYSHSITQHEIIEGQTDLLYIDESEEFQDIRWLARVEPDFIKIFETYEEAELECLKKLIEIVKNK